MGDGWRSEVHGDWSGDWSGDSGDECDPDGAPCGELNDDCWWKGNMSNTCLQLATL